MVGRLRLLHNSRVRGMPVNLARQITNTQDSHIQIKDKKVVKAKAPHARPVDNLDIQLRAANCQASNLTISELFLCPMLRFVQMVTFYCYSFKHESREICQEIGT